MIPLSLMRALFVWAIPLGCSGVSQEAQQQTDAAADAGPKCDADGWSTFIPEGDGFSFRGPCDLKRSPEKAIDSVWGRYDRPGTIITYDFGPYSSPLTEWEMYAGYASTPAVVDSRDATIVTARNANAADGLGYLAGIHFLRADVTGSRLTMDAHCAGEPERQIAKRVFETITFF